jgi:hypothetical protein
VPEDVESGDLSDSVDSGINLNRKIVYPSTNANMRPPFLSLLFACKAAVCAVSIDECDSVRTSGLCRKCEESGRANCDYQ